MRFSQTVTVLCDGDDCDCKAETEALVRVITDSTSWNVLPPLGWKVLRRVEGVLSPPGEEPSIPGGLYYFCFECHQSLNAP